MKVLLIENQIYLSEYYKVLLEQILHRPEVLEINTVELAQKAIVTTKYDLIVCDLHLDEHPEKESFLTFLEAHIGQTPFLLIATDRLLLWEKFLTFRAQKQNVRFIQKPFHRNDFFKITKNLIPSKQVKLIEEYMAIRTLLFFKYDQALCDVFVKIGKSKYVQLFKAGAEFSVTDIEKYINKSIDYLYVRWSDYSRFISESGERLPLMKLKTADSFELWKRESSALNAVIKSYGVNEDVFMQSIRSVVLAMKEINNSAVKNILQRKLEKQNYAYDHSYLVALIGAMITQSLKEFSERHATQISLAAFLHDLALEAEIAHVSSDNGSDYEALTPIQRKGFLQHPYKMYSLIKLKSLFSTDVERIIIEHHERENGSGFPRGLVASQLYFLSVVFIVAHDFVDELYKSNFDYHNKKEILDKLYNSYQSEKFKKVVLALSDVFEYPDTKIAV